MPRKRKKPEAVPAATVEEGLLRIAPGGALGAGSGVGSGAVVAITGDTKGREMSAAEVEELEARECSGCLAGAERATAESGAAIEASAGAGEELIKCFIETAREFGYEWHVAGRKLDNSPNYYYGKFSKRLPEECCVALFWFDAEKREVVSPEIIYHAGIEGTGSRWCCENFTEAYKTLMGDLCGIERVLGGKGIKVAVADGKSRGERLRCAVCTGCVSYRADGTCGEKDSGCERLEAAGGSAVILG